ncbi:MAG: GtrA family protein [Limisphaerales bacterium]
MKLLLTTLFHKNRQFFLYCVFGASGVTLDFLTYSAVVRWGGGHYQIANGIGYAAGTALSFALNAGFNFKTRDWLPLRFISFFSVAALGWAVSAGVLHFTVGRLGLDKYLAKVVTIFVVVPLQYNLNRLFSFRKSQNQAR